MYKRTAAPLSINTKAGVDGPAVVTAAFRYEEPARTRQTSRPPPPQQQQQRSSPQRAVATVAAVAAYPGSVSPSSMFVRALYDYDADDQTSLSFRQGDVIQVITQLESGWWDGMIHDVRGWFPSNYCAVIKPDAGGRSSSDSAEASAESGTDDDGDEPDHDAAARSRPPDGDGDDREAAFWIPQVTPDGRLFYFNTLTGVSTMELPLETPTSANETGPHDRMNIRVPDQTRPPPEMMAGGYERDEDDGSDGDDESRPYGRAPRRRRHSYISDGASPSASLESLAASPVARQRNDSRDYVGEAPFRHAAAHAAASYDASLLGRYADGPAPRSFPDDGAPPPTWNRLVEQMRRAVESYRQAINNADRAEYVRRAEDVSDNLRMLLAAASATTDNHSGTPSVISTNRALYPHFREMMSRFSKLVLSSHMAAADWPAPDAYAKCLQEAEGVLQGVYGFVEVARAQRGEEVPRLRPGFLVGSHAGGGWQNNGLGAARDGRRASSFIDPDEAEPGAEPPSARLDVGLLERMDDLKRMIVASMRRLDEQLVVADRAVTPARHEQLAASVCAAAARVVGYFRPYLATVESIDLAPLGAAGPDPQLTEFGVQKQRIYDVVAALVIACQTVAGPLADEWADVRGEPLEARVHAVRGVTKQLESSVSQLGFTLQLLLEGMPDEPAARPARDREPDPRTVAGSAFDDAALGQLRAAQLSPGRPAPAPYHAHDAAPDAAEGYRGKSQKVHDFFGEMPPPLVPGRDADETPAFLRLDHEGQIAYDMKVSPPQLRGGTLTALVEQLTRHDRLDSPFNNTFLLTYRSFTTAADLFELLVRRFSIQAPRGISQDDYQTWVTQKQRPIRIRVVNILKSWFDQFWMEHHDEASQALLRRVHAFAKDLVATTGTPGSAPLMAVVEQRLRGEESTAKRLVLNLTTAMPNPILPKSMKKLKFLDIDVLEFARQLTVVESRLYGKIRPTECLNKTWGRKVAADEPDPAPNVKALILHSNQLTNWVAEMILSQSDVKKRVLMIKHFVAVADVRPPRPPRPPPRPPLTGPAEMPVAEQLLHPDLHHLRPRHRAHPPPGPHLDAGQRAHERHARGDAEADEQHQELRRVPRDAPARQPALHPLLR
jgi:son of sevenless-like protein